MNSKKLTENIVKELSQYGRVEFNSPLSLHTTFKTGGNTEILITPYNEDSIAHIIPIIKNEHVPIHIIGGGSNLLISDNGLQGITIKISGGDNSFNVSDGYIYAGAGLSKEQFISDAINSGFGGIEFMAGIPGTIGGGIYMNAGTYMGSFSDILKRIRLLNDNASIVEVDIDELKSGYRRMTIPENNIIMGGYFSLLRTDNIAETKARIDSIIKDRWEKHPMDYPSAGSVFKNPKIYSSWKLINDSGLKGYRIGGAEISEKHTNFIINKGNATSSDIYNLIKYIQEKVYADTGVKLETEIKMMGEFDIKD
ncbi:MAG: UDP-N-acetylmuramate dehydrogenase [Leptospirales bacterium]|nr:UDP-N-acetylmuramate dehydrogenase [Leptospirales bacterium]